MYTMCTVCAAAANSSPRRSPRLTRGAGTKSGLLRRSINPSITYIYIYIYVYVYMDTCYAICIIHILTL